MLECFELSLDDNGVLEVVLNREKKLNLMNETFFRESGEIFQWASTESSVKVVLVHARGKHFSAGLDIKEAGAMLQGGDGDIGSLYKHISELQKTFMAIENCSKPTIAAVHGQCIGGGIDFVSACDIRLASKCAEFSVRETSIAIVADLGTLHRITRCCSKSLYNLMAFSGQNVSAATALNGGFVTHVYENRDALLQNARQLAKQIALNSPLTVQGTKRVLRFSERHSSADALDYVALWNSTFLRSPDLSEAMLAFMEKRQPVFKSKL